MARSFIQADSSQIISGLQIPIPRSSLNGYELYQPEKKIRTNTLAYSPLVVRDEDKIIL